MKVIVVGRDSTCDFVVNDLKVSRKHMQIIIGDNGECSVVDIGSMNGTFVNGIRIAREVRLHHGDVVRIGNTVLPWESLAAQQPKPSKMWIVYVLTAVAVLLLAVIAGIVIHTQRASKEPELPKKPAQTENAEDTETADEKESNDAYTRHVEKMRDKAEEEKKAADQAKTEAEASRDNANRKAKEADEAREKAVQDKNASRKERDKAVEAKKAADKAKTEAEEAKQKAEKEKQDAEKAKREAENRSNQNDRFYKSFSKLESKQYKQVAEDLGHVKCNDPRAAILNDFANANDSVARERIIKAVESVLKKKSTSAKGKAPSKSKAKGENKDEKSGQNDED